MKQIDKIKRLIIFNQLDAYIVPKNDEFFNEYAYPNRLKTISNFSGSAGFAIITRSINYLFVDGRYLIQGKNESGKNFKIIEIPNLYPKDILSNNKCKKIGYDPKLLTSSMIERFFGNNYKLIPIRENLVDKIYKEKKNKENLFYKIHDKIIGENVNSKINKLHQELKKDKIDNIFVSAPENIAWLLNIRGSDNPNSPIPNARLIMDEKKNIYFFSNLKKIKNIKKRINYKKIQFYSFESFYNILSKLNSKNFLIDGLSCSIFYESLIESKFKIVSYSDPIYNFKSIKNKAEIKNMKSVHIKDGVALTKFLYWIKQEKNFGFDELFLIKKLEKFRKKK